MSIPKFDDLFNPLLKALHALGGSASVTEQEDTVSAILNLSESDLADIHRGNRTKFSYRLAWARNYLKNFGLLENSARGVWSLTAKGQATTIVDKKTVKSFVGAMHKKLEAPTAAQPDQPSLALDDIAEVTWEDHLLEVVKSMAPDAFERLCQRLLRESGFVQVEVTGRTGDGGIDGKGVVQIGGLLSFHMIFQCKRYKGSVGSSAIRDFRGAMVGRADKGLLISTGSFTSEARKEAQREGAPPIDLVDGEALVRKLKEFELGVKVERKVVDEVTVVPAFFESI
jgi:restriction system protein